jgi:hypothetical protein
VLSTALSLLVVPAFYVVADGLKQRLSRRAATTAPITLTPEGPHGA